MANEQDPRLSEEELATPPPEPEQDQQPQTPDPDAIDVAQDAYDTYDQAKSLKEKLSGKGAKEGAETAAESSAEGGQLAQKAGSNASRVANAPKGSAERAAQARLRLLRTKIADGRAKIAARQAARQAGKQTAKQAGKAAAKWGAKATARWAAEAASGLVDAGLSWILLAADVLLTVGIALVKKFGKYLLVALAVIIALPGLFFALSFGALGSTILPSTPVEKSEAVVALALSDDPSATREMVINNAESMKRRLVTLKETAAKKYDQARSDAVSADLQSVEELIEALITVAGDKEERSKVTTEINDALKSFAEKYPELLFSAGNCGDLKKYIDDGSFSDGRPARQKDLRSISAGTLNRGGHSSIPRSEAGPIPVNPKLCGVLIFLLDNGFKLGSSTLTYGHRKMTSSGNVSQHYVGEAIDLAMINGVGSPGSQKWQDETRRMQTLLQQHAKELGIYQLIGPHRIGVARCSNSTYTDSSHRDHIHIGVAGERHEQRYETCKK